MNDLEQRVYDLEIEIQRLYYMFEENQDRLDALDYGISQRTQYGESA